MDTNVNQKVSCVVNYTYDASEPDEISIKPGDVIKEVERLPGGWWRGELRGRKGMFPDNFVTVLTEQTNARSSGIQGRCKAVFNYQPAHPDELPLYLGDTLEVLGEVEEGWWQGRRQGRVGVFPSNFVVMIDPEPSSVAAPALPPKPVKEQCRVLFPYTAVNEDELTLAEGEVVTIVSKDAPDRGWWRGELHGRVGLFPDNFVQLLPAGSPDVEEKKPDRPPSKSNSGLYPILNKYTEKTSSVKELTTSKISSHKENSLSKESSTQSTVTHTNRSETEKLINNEAIVDSTVDGQLKKPPVPLKKSPTPSSSVSGLLSGLKNKMLSSSSSDKEKSSPTISSSVSGEWDRTDGGAVSKTQSNSNVNVISNNTNTFDHVERNSILNDPRAGRVKAPRRRPPSQVFRDDSLQHIGLSNGHEIPIDKPVPEKAEEIKPRSREWEKHKAPWMEELKLNQAKKTTPQSTDGKTRSASASEGGAFPARSTVGSTDRILECGLEERKSTHSMEMSKSTSSISSKLSVMESFEETKTRHSLDSKKEVSSASEAAPKPTANSPTAAGRTFTSMVEEIKKPTTPAPPSASVRTSTDLSSDKSLNKSDKSTKKSDTKPTTIETPADSTTHTKPEKTSTIERISQTLSKTSEEKVTSVSGEKGLNTLERRLHVTKRETEKCEGAEALIAQLNNRVLNLEKLLEVQNAKFTAAIEELNTKLKLESDKRQALQSEIEKLAQCVTQV